MKRILTVLAALVLLACAGCTPAGEVVPTVTPAPTETAAATPTPSPTPAPTETQAPTPSSTPAPTPAPSPVETGQAELIFETVTAVFDGQELEVSVPQLAGEKDAPGLEEVNKALLDRYIEYYHRTAKVRLAGETWPNAVAEDIITAQAHSYGSVVSVVLRHDPIPCYSTDGEVYVISYDREKGAVVPIDETLEEWGRREEDVQAAVLDQWWPTHPAEEGFYVESVQLKGCFRTEDGKYMAVADIHSGAEGADPWKYIQWVELPE